MVNSRGADIIPFPVRRLDPPAPVAADRLTEAMASLSKALADQHSAVQRWRTAMDALNQSMQQLSTGAPTSGGFTPHAS